MFQICLEKQLDNVLMMPMCYMLLQINIRINYPSISVTYMIKKLLGAQFECNFPNAISNSLSSLLCTLLFEATNRQKNKKRTYIWR